MKGSAGFSRRGLLDAGIGAVAGAWVGRAEAAGAEVERRGYPFTLGVASGAPSATGVVLWTRLAPSPLEPGGGLAPRRFPVQ